MVSPAPPLALLSPARPLPAPDDARVGSWASSPCESCRSAPATLTVTWPDTRFRVCSACLPPAAPAGGVLDVAAIPVTTQHVRWPAAPRTRASWPAGGRPRLADAPPARALPGAAGTTGAARPAGPAVLEPAEREALQAAAHTVLTSPPAPRGRRLSSTRACDVVAALTLAAGGAIDETGRPAAPAERPAACLLRRVLRQVANQLSQGAGSGSWTGAPVVLIDAWQAHPGLTGAARAAVLLEAADGSMLRSSRGRAEAGTASAPRAAAGHDELARRPGPAASRTPAGTLR